MAEEKKFLGTAGVERLIENIRGEINEAVTDTAADLYVSQTNFAAEVAKVKVANATNADEATKATQDGNGKVITDTYETKIDAGEKLKEAKEFAKESLQDFGSALVNGVDTEGNDVVVAYANEANSATKATQDSNGDVIADTYAKKATTLAGYEIGDAYTKTEVNDLIQGAKDYANNNDANTEYHVEYDSTNKKIKLVAGADASKMEIPTDDFIKDGMIQSVAISDDGKDLVITWNTDAGKEATNIPLTELVDVMTGVDGTTITVNVSADDKISAEVKTGSIKDGHIASDAAIAKVKLASDVQTSLGLADSAVQEADIEGLRSDSHTHANKALLDTYTQTEANLADAVAKKHEHSNKAELDLIASGDKAKWDTAAGKAHEHSNKDVIDDITAASIQDWNDAFGKSHEHENRTVLDGITSAKVTAWDAAASASYTEITADDIDAMFAD